MVMENVTSTVFHKVNADRLRTTDAGHSEITIGHMSTSCSGKQKFTIRAIFYENNHTVLNHVAQ